MSGITLRRTAPDPIPVITNTASDYTISINGTSVNPSNISWVSTVTMAAPSTSNIYFGKLPSFYNSNISSINPCSSVLIGDFVVLNKNHEYDSWDNTGSDFYNKGPPTECLSVGGDAIIENRLGVGTVSPAYELDVVGDINFTGNIYQNSDLFSGGDTTFVEGLSVSELYPLLFGNDLGIYVASASSESPSDWKAWKAFNQTVGDEGWHTVDAYNSSTGNYTGIQSTTYNGSSTVSGEWIQLHFKIGGIATNKIEIAPRTGYLNRCAGDGIILGSTDGSTWTSIHNFSGQTYTNGNYTSITFTTSPIYTYLRLVVTKLSGTGDNTLNISEIRYSGFNKCIYYNSGSVGIGTTNPIYGILHVDGYVYYGEHYNSIYSEYSVLAGSYFTHSDSRIKKNVTDINDSSALDKIRLLEPKIYNYIDEKKGTSNVYGFIAQQVANVLPHAVTIGRGDIPNILTNSNVIVTENSNVLELHLDTPVEVLSLSNTSVINITTDKGTHLKVPVLSFYGSNVITIENTDEFSNVTNAFIKGEHILDFHILNKDAIWAVSTAALQEVDRQLQAEKAKVADLLARVTALENN
ncbi:hypothetical protein BpV2_057 [Bathycoccus sp. RCC1105 virus BpV2]|nr:hypothetical protein BpV2_057 [Bathycoccus sp. RCC1105 virus BpV2]